MTTRLWRREEELCRLDSLAQTTLYDLPHDRHDRPPPLPAMDADLIKLVNKLQDTFANLGQSRIFLPHRFDLLQQSLLHQSQGRYREKNDQDLRQFMIKLKRRMIGRFLPIRERGNNLRLSKN